MNVVVVFFDFSIENRKSIFILCNQLSRCFISVSGFFQLFGCLVVLSLSFGNLLIQALYFLLDVDVFFNNQVTSKGQMCLSNLPLYKGSVSYCARNQLWRDCLWGAGFISSSVLLRFFGEGGGVKGTCHIPRA